MIDVHIDMVTISPKTSILSHNFTIKSVRQTIKNSSKKIYI